MLLSLHLSCFSQTEACLQFSLHYAVKKKQQNIDRFCLICGKTNITCAGASISQVRRDGDPPALLDAHPLQAFIHPGDQPTLPYQAHFSCSFLVAEEENKKKGIGSTFRGSDTATRLLALT